MISDRFRHQPLEPFVVLTGQNGLVLHMLYFAWNFCIKLEPHQLTVILGLMSTTVFSGNLLPGKPVVTDLVSEPG